MNNTSSTIVPTDTQGKTRIEFSWCINFSKKYQSFYISKSHSPYWTYCGTFLYEIDALEFFCNHQILFAELYQELKSEEAEEVITCYYSMRRAVSFIYKCYDANAGFVTIDEMED